MSQIDAKSDTLENSGHNADSLPLVTVSQVSKNYCRDLRQSLWYGVQEIFREMTFRNGYTGDLRPGEFEAVKKVSFEIQPGECVAMLGPNGAGKSSMLKMINGILRPTQGEIRIRGRISALIELGTGFNPILTGRENVFINASVLGFSREETEEIFDDILEFSEIGEFIDAPVRTYSSGMKVRLGFAVASHLAPDLMLIDEVLAVGDLAFRMKCREHLKQKVKNGVSVILVSHIVSLLPQFCTRSIVFDRGEIAFDGDVMEGIAKYQKILGLEKAKTTQFIEEEILDVPEGIQSSEEQPTDRIQGVQIHSVQTLNESLQPCETFETNEPITVEVVLESAISLENCKLVLNLDSATFGLVACMSSQRNNFNFDISADRETKLLIRLGKLPIIDGGYAFNLTLYGEGKSNLLDQKSAMAPFQVLNPGQKPRALKGVLVLEHQWSISDPENGN